MLLANHIRSNALQVKPVLKYYSFEVGFPVVKMAASVKSIFKYK